MNEVCVTFRALSDDVLESDESLRIVLENEEDRAVQILTENAEVTILDSTGKPKIRDSLHANSHSYL